MKKWPGEARSPCSSMSLPRKTKISYARISCCILVSVQWLARSITTNCGRATRKTTSWSTKEAQPPKASKSSDRSNKFRRATMLLSLRFPQQRIFRATLLTSRRKEACKSLDQEILPLQGRWAVLRMTQLPVRGLSFSVLGHHHRKNN